MAARVELLVVGSLHRDLAPAARHYIELLRPHMTITVREVKEVALRGRSEAEVLRDEGRRLLAAWPQAPVVSALVVEGAALDTEAFAARLQRSFERGGAAFVIGGSLGLASEVRVRATDALSLSAMTLPHQLARVVLLEQLFRAGKILRGEPYHH
ncbi:MAG TPA: 23S rRNA (pseudouridine(1915)-N(3))-methyltransferase RlmH [Thermoleophilia bacterium]|nr:23S rRNA (pseudouridine(1915)-N(3))-methyltransferase RlmH [Thermoleophilia bacterium]